MFRLKMTKLVIIGGFLGAGKTTCILELTKMLRSDGKKVGVITNDQGSSLVDTEYLKQQDLPVLEVTGGCFCCNFSEFAERLSQMTEQHLPDFILAEPVGSCTDLVATIMKPMAMLNYNFTMSPLSVVVDPLRLWKVMSESESPFPDEINYLFRKQLEEADIILLNKTDTLLPAETEDMLSFLQHEYPGADVIPVSAKKRKGLEVWLSKIAEYKPATGKPSLDIEYDIYARAEAFLGWLNLTAAVNCKDGFNADSFLEQTAEAVKAALAENQNEIAHLKMYIVSRDKYARLSCVSTHDDVKFDRKMSACVNEASLVINIRAAAEPELLHQITEKAVGAAAQAHDCTVTVREVEAFKPAYPRPLHRI